MKKLTAVLASALFAVAVSPASLIARSPMVSISIEQAQVGNILGTATSSGGTATASASVNLVNSLGQSVTTTVTNTVGGFSFTGLPAGAYTVNVMGTVVVNGVSTTAVIGTQTIIVAAGQTVSVAIATTALTSALATAAAEAAVVAAGTSTATAATVATVLATSAVAATTVVVANASPSR